MDDSNDYFSNDINSEYWDDVYYEEHKSDYPGGYRSGGRSGSGSPWLLAFIVGMLFSFIAPDISGYAFIVTLIIAAIAKKYGK